MAKATGKSVAAWAIKKYGKDALYMLEETHEGREVWGQRATSAAIKLLKSTCITYPGSKRKRHMFRSKRR
jgi:hypothetical protein